MERLKKLFIISLIISIIVLVLVTVFTIGPDTLPILLRMEPVYLLAAVALHVVSYFIWGLRMKVMTEALGYRIGVKDATEIVIANLFAASVTPSMAGGEPVRIHMLNRNANVPVGDASAVVIGERVLDALLLLIATPFALWVLSGSLISREMDLAIIGAELFVLLMVFVAIGGLLNPTFIDWLSSLISRGLHRVGRFDRSSQYTSSLRLVPSSALASITPISPLNCLNPSKRSYSRYTSAKNEYSAAIIMVTHPESWLVM